MIFLGEPTELFSSFYFLEMIILSLG